MSKRELHVGVVGVGARGFGLVRDNMCGREGIHIDAICDPNADNCQRAVDAVQNINGNTPVVFSDYRELLKMDSIDTVVVTSTWDTHIPVSIAAMRAGKAVGCEVGGAFSVDDCWQLVRAQEETGMPCMMLENCCYGREELMVLNMVKKGVLGSIVHCKGGYQHDLRVEASHGLGKHLFRLHSFMNRNCESYPTHELGPIAKVLGINRGNRMVSLSSFASPARGLNEYVRGKFGDDHELAHYPFVAGDIVTTVIRCAHGETIVLTLDMTLPRYYSRGFEVHGTKGMYIEDTKSVFIDGIHNKDEGNWEPQWGNINQFRDEYDHPIWRKFIADGVRGGHGGMDTLVFDAFFMALQEGYPMPIDVYDMAAWKCITALSEESIALGGAPVAIPDFTNGKWIYREEDPDWTYCLSKICE